MAQNNYELKKPTRYDFKSGQIKQNRNKSKWLLLIHYPSGKHYLFIVNETERKLLKRVKSICFDSKDKIDYLNVYEIQFNDRLKHYGEYTYKAKERNLK